VLSSNSGILLILLTTSLHFNENSPEIETPDHDNGRTKRSQKNLQNATRRNDQAKSARSQSDGTRSTATDERIQDAQELAGCSVFRECLLCALALSLSAAQPSPGEEDETGRPVPSRVEGWGWCRRLEVSDSHKKYTVSPGTYWLKNLYFLISRPMRGFWRVNGETADPKDRWGRRGGGSPNPRFSLVSCIVPSFVEDVFPGRLCVRSDRSFLLLAVVWLAGRGVREEVQKLKF
jgi:hypothetical protein